MSENFNSQTNSHQIMNLINKNNQFSSIMPSYMRNINSIILKQKELSRISWEKEGQERISLTTEEKRIIKLLILKGVPKDKRSDLWLITSGAKRELVNNPGYYEFLIENYPPDIELPTDKQIDLDLRRTFPEDPLFADPLILQKLKNILLAFSRRNVSIGYVQGFNFIVGRLLKINTNEEEVFWIFCQIIEYILPINFYSEMAGLMIDVDIMLLLLQKYFPDLIWSLEEKYFLEYFKNILLQWFLSLFIQNFSYEAGLVLWDILFIDKFIVLFKAVIGLMKYVYKDLVSSKIESLEVFRNFLKDSFNNFNDLSYLMYFISLRKFEFNSNIIERNRIFLERSTIEHINNINIHKLKKLKERIFIMDEECNLDWQICIYDAEAAYKVTDHFVYKLSEKIVLIDDYFDNGCINYKTYVPFFEKSVSRNSRKNTYHYNYSSEKSYNSDISSNSDTALKSIININYKNEEHFLSHPHSKQSSPGSFSNLLIERRRHCCEVSKRNKKAKIPLGYSIVLDQLNDLENEELINISTGTEDKSNDCSIERWEAEKSFNQDKFEEKNDENSIRIEKDFHSNGNSNKTPESKCLHASRKKLYKDMKLQAKKCISMAVNEFTPEKDFQTFVSKINFKHNMISQTKSFYLKNFDMNKKVNSTEVSYEKIYKKILTYVKENLYNY